MTELKEFIEKSGINANNHGWKVRWNPMMSGNMQEVQKGYKYLSIGDALALIHSEVSEALDAYRNDDSTNFREECADIAIRLFHICYDLKIDLEQEIKQKMKINEQRPINHGRKNY